MIDRPRIITRPHFCPSSRQGSAQIGTSEFDKHDVDGHGEPYQLERICSLSERRPSVLGLPSSLQLLQRHPDWGDGVLNVHSTQRHTLTLALLWRRIAEVALSRYLSTFNVRPRARSKRTSNIHRADLSDCRNRDIDRREHFRSQVLASCASQSFDVRSRATVYRHVSSKQQVCEEIEDMQGARALETLAIARQA